MPEISVTRLRMDPTVRPHPKKLSLALILVLLSALLIQSIGYLNYLKTGDEFLNLRIAQHLYGRETNPFASIASVYGGENLLGYGAVFWTLLTGLQCAGEHSPVLFRIILLLLWMATLVKLIYSTSMELRWPVLLLALTAPSTWWYGKLVAPELFSAYLGFLACLLILNSSDRFQLFPWVLIGLSCGIKPTNAPYAVFALTTHYLRSRAGVRECFLLGLGFLAANPFLLNNPVTWLERISKVTSPMRLSLDHVLSIFVSSKWEWDLVYSGGFFVWIYHPLTLLLISAVLIRAASREVVISWFLALILLTTLIICNGRYLGWYWISAPFITLLALSSILPNTRSGEAKRWLWVALFVQVISGTPRILEQFENRSEHAANFQTLSQARQCIQDRLQGVQYKTVIDLIDPLPSITVQPDIAAISGWYAMQWFSDPGQSDPSPRMPIVAIIGTRMRARGPLAGWQAEQLQQNLPKFRVTSLGSCFGSDMFLISVP